jgi:hypothetical protein
MPLLTRLQSPLRRLPPHRLDALCWIGERNGVTEGLSWLAAIFQVADFSGRILCWACTCAASSNESSYAVRFRCALELGVSEFQLNRGGLGGRIGKEEPPCPLLRLAEVQTDPCDGTFPDRDFGTGIKPATSNEHAAPTGESRRTDAETSLVLLVAFGGGLPDATALWSHTGQDRGATLASRVGGRPVDAD